jgi:Fe-S cluster assembly protein SufD
MEEKKVFIIQKNEEKSITLEQSGVYEVQLVGEGAHATISGKFQAIQSEKVSVTVIINHMAAHTCSNTVLKGVARDTAQVSFTGRIIVGEHCPDTNAFLTERILLLSDTARAEAVPDLEILTDDVKCSHAASISHIPEDQIFYLRSRGVSQAEAEALIVAGFLESGE